LKHRAISTTTTNAGTNFVCGHFQIHHAFPQGRGPI
jgi:hypothetical protein